MAIPTERPPTVSKVTLMVDIWIGVLLAVLTVCMRIFIRMRYHGGRFQLDDIFTGFALAILITSALLYVFAMNPLFTLALVGSGKEYPPPANFVQTTNLYMRLQFAITMLFWTCLWTVKASFLTFFYPLSAGLKTDRKLWYAVTAFVSCGYIVSVISYPISCSTFTIGSCDSERHVQLSLVSLRLSTAMDIISDAFIIFLPWKLIWVVRRPRKEKIAIGSIVGLGVLVISFAVIRIVVTNVTHTHPEPVWLALWSANETAVAVIVISLTSLKAVLANRTGSTVPSTPKYGYSSSRSGGRQDSSRGAIQLDETGLPQKYQLHNGEVRKGTTSTNDSEEILVT